jgi:hypothetical protein
MILKQQWSYFQKKPYTETESNVGGLNATQNLHIYCNLNSKYKL